MKFTKVALVSVIGMSSLVGAAHSTFAEVSSVGNSKSSITFVAGTGPVTPVDPNVVGIKLSEILRKSSRIYIYLTLNLN
ncbi:hypothetical protein ABWK22_23340 [Gottfriedia acidiceleris]|uniref:hypothetical protein n=1 Tax=Gottfriedia acidiceleris TaxID=371036 RepID=UPI00339927E6